MVSYKKSKAGIFTAEYNFEEEDDGETEPTGWTNDDDGAGTESRIAAEFRGHRKVLESYDVSGANDAEIYHDFAAAKDSGIVEFFGSVGSINESVFYYLRKSDDTNICFVQFFASASTYVIKNAAAITISSEYYNGRWTHVAICFNNSGGAKDCGDGENLDDGKYRVYLDGVKIDDYALTNADDAERFTIRSNTTPP